MRKVIVLSTNSNPDYLYYIPLVCWAWKQFGWWPHVFSVNSPYNIKLVEFAFGECPLLTSRSINAEGYKSDTIAQVSRLYAACCFDLHDYLMTSDADMLPLSDYWQANPKVITSWGHDLTNYEHYPICYIGMTGYRWMKVMEMSGCDYESYIQRDLEAFPQSSSKDKIKRWVADQDIITSKLRPFNPTVINRGTGSNGYPRGRVDRSAWSLNHKELIDAHLYHGAWRKGNEWMFENIMQLLHRVWPGENFEWFVNYTRKFREIAS